MAMAQDPPEIATLKAQKAQLDAEKELLASELAKLKAQRELSQAQADATSANAKVAAETQTALANAEKAKSQAQKEALEAEVAATKAKLGVGLVQGTTAVSGAVNAGTGAGNLESSLLAAKALNRAASEIRTAVGPTESFIIFTGTARPNFGDLRLFEIKVDLAERGYKAATEALEAANKAYREVPKAAAPKPPATLTSEGPVRESLMGAAVTAGAALDTVAKLGSYFQSDYMVSAATVTGADSDLLAVSLASKLSKAWYPARWPPPAPKDAVRGVLGKLPELRDTSVEQIVQMLELQERVADEAAAEKNAGRKKALEVVSTKYAAVAAAFTSANTAYDGLLTSLAEVDTGGVARVTRLMEQKAIHDALATDRKALIVNVAGAGGTTYTKKNLWTFFGGMPFYVSGGAIASYLVIDRTGAIEKAGQLPLHSGYMKAVSVPDKL